MPKFRYVAYDNFGRRQAGYIEADTRDIAVSLVKRKGLQPTLMLGPYGRSISAGKWNVSRVRIKSLAAYTRKFSQLYNAGVGIDEIFEFLGEEEDIRNLREVSAKLASDIRGGASLEEALRKYPVIFPPLFIALFNTGIQSGNLDKVADNLASLYEKESALRIQMASKLAYPVALLVIFLIASFFMTRFVSFFPEGVATFLITTWVIIIGAVIFFCTPLGYPILRSILMRLPYIGGLMLKTNMARFCRILGLLYGSGVPLLEALDLSEQTLQDPRLARSIRHVKVQVNEGADLATAMKRAGMIPARVISMIAVGERGGEVGAILEKMSAYYEIEIEHQHNVLVVVSYFVVYGLVAITAAIVIISFWSGYFRFALSAGEW